MNTERNKEVVRRVLEEFWHNGRVEALDEFFAPDYINHNLSNPDEKGLNAYKQWATGTREAFAQGFRDWRITIEDLVAEGDRVAKRWVFTGTHTGDYAGVHPTGKRVSMRGVTIYVFNAQGKVKEIWWNYDLFGLMQQIGAVPAAV